MADNPRILELRRRVQEDPASLAFAELAEECRRGGLTEEAADVARAGLIHHPDNLTARVTLGRALVELDRLDEAFTELSLVLDQAPGDLPAIRALAEIYQRRGLMSEALVHYRRALELAHDDADFEPALERIRASATGPQPPAAGDTPATAGPIEDLFDFDTLVSRLASEPVPAEPSYRPLVVEPPVQSPIQAIELADTDEDSFAVMERQLRELDEQRARDEQLAREVEAARRRLLVMQELETWLTAIVADRRAQQQSA